LLLLRAAVGAVAMWCGIAGLGGSGFALATLADGLAALSGVMLLIGIFTPIASGAIALGAAVMALSGVPSPADALASKVLTIFVAVVAVAVTLLGPGALSLDARLFGRREIIIPRMSRPSNS